MNTPLTHGRSPALFFLLVFALSIPLSVAGGITGEQIVPGVPVSAAIVAFCPMIAALLLVYAREKNAGVIALVKKGFDFGQPAVRLWYIPALLVMPPVMAMEYGWLRVTGSQTAAPRFRIWSPLVMLVVYYIAALFHATINVSWQLFPINGSFYDPRITGLLVTALAVAVILVWSPETLADYRFSERN